jgi:DNA helicase-2/ATP-dependent DNA helicase PcrA
LVEKFANEKSMKTMELTNNFRSNQNIVNLCQKIIPPTVNIKGNKNVESFSCVFVSYPKDEIAKLPTWFENYLTQFNNIKIRNSLIVSRGRGTISSLRPSASNGLKLPHEFALSIKLWDEGNLQSLNDAISLMGKYIASKFFEEFTVTSNQFYKPSIVSKASDWRTYISKILNECILIEGAIGFDKTWTDWAKLIKTDLPKIIQIHMKILEFAEKDYVFNSTAKFNLQSPKGETKKMVIDTIKFSPASTSSIPIRTIHAVKGQTFETVMLVSSLYKGQGSKTGHWEDWLSDKNSEAARIAYVASSRPRKLLVWAVPNIDSTQKNKLIELGFKQEEWGIN